MPAGDDLHQTTLWTLEDDFEGLSTPMAQQEEAPADTLPVTGKMPADDEPPGQPPGEISFDGQNTYSYTGYVREDGGYVQRRFRFTCDEIYVYPSEDPERVCAMVDSVGRDAERQAEIKRYGRRAWHSPYRPEDAALQGLDWIFRHDVELVSACYPCVVSFYAADAAGADRWTMAMYDSYKSWVLYKEHTSLLRLLAEAEIPPSVLGLDPDRQAEV